MASRWADHFLVSPAYYPLYNVLCGSLRWIVHDPFSVTILQRVLIVLGTTAPVASGASPSSHSRHRLGASPSGGPSYRSPTTRSSRSTCSARSRVSRSRSWPSAGSGSRRGRRCSDYCSPRRCWCGTSTSSGRSSSGSSGSATSSGGSGALRRRRGGLWRRRLRSRLLALAVLSAWSAGATPSRDSVFHSSRRRTSWPSAKATRSGLTTAAMCGPQTHWLSARCTRGRTSERVCPHSSEAIGDNPDAVAGHFGRNARLFPAGLEVGLFNAKFGSVGPASNPDYIDIKRGSWLVLAGLIGVGLDDPRRSRPDLAGSAEVVGRVDPRQGLGLERARGDGIGGHLRRSDDPPPALLHLPADHPDARRCSA